MRLFACVAGLILIPTTLLAQTGAVSTPEPMAGVEIWLTGPECDVDAFVVLDGTALPALRRPLPADPDSDTDDTADRALGWQVMLPAALEAKTYSVRWQCGVPNPDTTPPQVDVIDVQALVPKIESVTVLPGEGSGATLVVPVKQHVTYRVSSGRVGLWQGCRKPLRSR